MERTQKLEMRLNSQIPGDIAISPLYLQNEQIFQILWEVQNDNMYHGKCTLTTWWLPIHHKIFFVIVKLIINCKTISFKTVTVVTTKLLDGAEQQFVLWK